MELVLLLALRLLRAQRLGVLQLQEAILNDRAIRQSPEELALEKELGAPFHGVPGCGVTGQPGLPGQAA